ncbi:MAG: HAD hydrolase family protein [Anaerolineae bacterium]|nr:HAD hydrolase family protein [Anaerolineae bacterium]
MHLSVLACDLDGTLAEHDRVAPKTWQALRQAKAAGLTLMLVTGRRLDTFAANGLFAELCEAIVAENGAVVYFPRRDIVALPFGQLATTLWQRLKNLDIPLDRGTAIVATHVPHDQAILDLLREVGGGATIEYNRGAVMVLPPGATKGTGLHYALHELGYSPHNVIACGDAENDRSLFEMVELGAAVANAAPEVQDLADVVLSEVDGAGVRSLIETLLRGQLPAHLPRLERRLLLGQDAEGEPIHLDPFALVDGNLGIFGASISGKSWLGGLLAEEMLKQGYQLCIIDPEGDYRSLRAFPHSLVLGGPGLPLPSVVDVVTFAEYSSVNLVIDLSGYDAPDKAAYVTDLLRALRGLRARRGRPHWFLIDEVQNFSAVEGGELTNLLLQMMIDGGICLVSFRPSQVDPFLLKGLDHWLITRLSLPEEIEAVAPFLTEQLAQPELVERLPHLPVGQAYLSFNDARWSLTPQKGVISFRSGPRAVPHIRHLHKYLKAPLPEAKRFFFHDPTKPAFEQTAASLWEFREALEQVPRGSLQYHLQREDFEQWLKKVLHDDELARRISKIRRRNLFGPALRQALLQVVIDRYEELDTLL